VVSGRLDASTVDDFGAELDRASVAGVHELVVDLTGVTHLASAGIQALHRFSTALGRHGAALTLYAPEGCVAAQVLPLTGLPHTTTPPPGQSP
jgi:anti-anti-sigma factor